MSDSPRAAIARAVARRRAAKRQLAGLALLATVGVVLATHTSFTLLGKLLTGTVLVSAAIQLVTIAWTREQIRVTADQLIDTGTPAGADTAVIAELDARMQVLRGERERRLTARSLRDAIIEARRPRSSNPLVLAGRNITLTKGAARALIAERELAIRIATTLAEPQTDPRAILAVRNILFPQPGAALSPNQQERGARDELHRAAHILGIDQNVNASSSRLLAE